MKQTSETKCKWNSVQYMEEISRIQRHPAVDNLHESHHEEVHQQEGPAGSPYEVHCIKGVSLDVGSYTDQKANLQVYFLM